MISLLLYTKSNLTHYKTGGQPMEKAVSCGGVVIYRNKILLLYKINIGII